MRFHLGDIPESEDFIPDASWRPLIGSSVVRFQLLAFPLGIIATALFALLWVTITPLKNEWRTLFPLPVLGLAGCLVGVLIVHEFLHALIHPGAGRSRHSVIGFWPSRMFLYATYDGELTRSRSLSILLTPFIVISILPFIVAVVAQVGNVWIAYITTVNAYLASGDMLAAGYFLFKIPTNAVVRNQGRKAYMRTKPTKAEQDAAPNSRPPSQMPTSPEVRSSDSQRTPSSGGCG